jgi:hypothetical protein
VSAARTVYTQVAILSTLECRTRDRYWQFPSVGLAIANPQLVSRSTRSAVAVEHGSVRPPRNAHEVAIVAACRHPSVSERVPELVSVQALDARLRTSPLEHLLDPGVAKRADVTQPQHGIRISRSARKAAHWRTAAR